MWDQDINDFVGQAKAAQCSESFWTTCTDAFAAYGVTGIGYGIVPFKADVLHSGNSAAGFFRHSYSPDWEAASSSVEGPVENDASVDLILDGMETVYWHDGGMIESATQEQRLQYEIDNDHGLRFGASIALGKTARGQNISGVGLWFDHIKSPQQFSKEWQAKSDRLRQIALVLDEMTRGEHHRLLTRLSEREETCLSNLAIGLRPAEICWKLGISEKTFEKFVRGAKVKLNARTRDHAVAKALLIGAIQP